MRQLLRQSDTPNLIVLSELGTRDRCCDNLTLQTLLYYQSWAQATIVAIIWHSEPNFFHHSWAQATLVATIWHSEPNFFHQSWAQATIVAARQSDTLNLILLWEVGTRDNCFDNPLLQTYFCYQSWVHGYIFRILTCHRCCCIVGCRNVKKYHKSRSIY